MNKKKQKQQQNYAYKFANNTLGFRLPILFSARVVGSAETKIEICFHVLRKRRASLADDDVATTPRVRGNICSTYSFRARGRGSTTVISYGIGVRPPLVSARDRLDNVSISAGRGPDFESDRVPVRVKRDLARALFALKRRVARAIHVPAERDGSGPRPPPTPVCVFRPQYSTNGFGPLIVSSIYNGSNVDFFFPSIAKIARSPTVAVRACFFRFLLTLLKILACDTGMSRVSPCCSSLKSELFKKFFSVF